VIACPASVAAECQSSSGAVISVPPATVSDSCSGAPVVVNDYNGGGADASGVYPLGTTTVTFTADDGAGVIVSCSTSITVADTTPPVVRVQASPAQLWPPDHTMRPVHLTVTAVDVCDPNPVVILSSSSSSEPDDAPGQRDGRTSGDVQGATIGTLDTDVLLRAERDDQGPGRVYSLSYVATDASGNDATREARVEVPRNKRPAPPAGPLRTTRPGRS
jgi:hypothetical protein